MSDTPRMNAARNAAMEHMTGDVWRVGCDIEHELNAANAEIEEKRKDVVWLATEKAKLEERIKRLEEALGGTVKCFVDLADSGDAGFWNPDEQSVIIAARAALEAKEAKP